jgi:hypothetical protein
MGMVSTRSVAAEQHATAICQAPQKVNRGMGSSCGGVCAKKQPGWGCCCMKIHTHVYQTLDCASRVYGHVRRYL